MLEKRLAIVLDHENIWRVLQKYNLRIDYKMLREEIGESFNIVDAIVYLGFPEWQAAKKIQFLKSLMRAGWYFVFKTWISIQNGVIMQNSIPQVMMTHIKQLEKTYDKIAIIGGDSRILYATKNFQMEVEIWDFRECLSNEIIRYFGSDHIKYLDELLFDDRCIIKL